MTRLTITEMVKRFGISCRTLRFYEERHLIKPLRKGPTRAYSQEDCRRVALIMQGKKLGFSLEEISHLMSRREPADALPPDLTEMLDPQSLKNQMLLLQRERERVCEALEELKAAQAKLDTPAERVVPTASRS